MTERLRATISGRVQGVNFRWYTQREAQRLELTGYALNQADGAVEVVAEGEHAALEELLRWLHHGSPSARVDEVRAEWLPARQEFTRFEVK
ncbi:MAG: acylphosphatase [Chloroflexi bacterium]|nr:acylphosphatase [Chloroflexota bacterium]